MTTAICLVGEKFGKLTVLSRSKRVSGSGAMWDCVCDCGGKSTSASLKLRRGLSKSCGCLRREISTNFKHGYANKTKTYKTWKCMRSRCTNPDSDQWEWYGGRGIKICKEWDDFSVFLADMGERPEGTSIDRIDPNGDYSKGNCRWATAKQQAETNRGCFVYGGLRSFEKVKGVASK